MRSLVIALWLVQGPPSKCNFPLEKGNFYSIFSSSPVSAVSQNNLCAKEAYSGGGTVSHPSPAPGPYPDDKMTEWQKLNTTKKGQDAQLPLHCCGSALVTNDGLFHGAPAWQGIWWWRILGFIFLTSLSYFWQEHYEQIKFWSVKVSRSCCPFVRLLNKHVFIISQILC